MTRRFLPEGRLLETEENRARCSTLEGLAQALAEVLRSFQGRVVSSGMEEGIAVEMSALLEMLKMDEGAFSAFFRSQMELGNRFSGPLFSLLREAYGNSTIDRIQDFGALMEHFRKLNDLIIAFQNEAYDTFSPKEVEFYLQNAEITDIALEASARLYCTPKEACRVAQAVRNFAVDRH